MALQTGLVSYPDPLSCAILAFCAVYNNRHTQLTHTHTPTCLIELTELGLGREAVLWEYICLMDSILFPLYLQTQA